MGNIVELFPDSFPDDDELGELRDHYGQMMNWGSAPPLEQAECLFNLGKELLEINHPAVALDAFRASNRAVSDVEGSEIRDALQSVIRSHYRKVCETVYGPREESWPIDERNFLTSSE